MVLDPRIAPVILAFIPEHRPSTVPCLLLSSHLGLAPPLYGQDHTGILGGYQEGGGIMGTLKKTTAPLQNVSV